jgi:hypothetical protein
MTSQPECDQSNDIFTTKPLLSFQLRTQDLLTGVNNHEIQYTLAETQRVTYGCPRDLRIHLDDLHEYRHETTIASRCS